ncbi:sensor histidine kinase [Chitinophaga sp. Cy-1792]|uniref:sensor histidine kinase n=1 Tax=Chitinophaga sp. Cy-1792 TaxID=2608339 RepID=UPI00141E346B|nr:histidine kinase [Chitinophaga sp. Cy-1792]
MVNTFLNYCKTHRVQAHLFFWVAMLLLSVSTDFFEGPSWSFMSSLIYALVLLITQIPTAYFLAYFVIPRLSSHKKIITTTLLAILVCYLLSVFARILVVYVAEPLVLPFTQCTDPLEPKEPLSEIATDLYKLFKVYVYHTLSIPFLFLTVKLFKDQYDIREKAIRLEKEKIATELKLLKNQLNPHFLFNTLNNIYSLSIVGSPHTSDAIFRLSEMLDHVLYKSQHPLIPIREEVQLIENYCSLERLRYTDSLQFKLDIDIRQELEVPPLILVSVVENAFKHGLSNTKDNPAISIKVTTGEDVVTFDVVNTVGDNMPETRNGKIGLLNIRQQLELIYPGDYVLDVARDDDYFKVHLAIRIKTRQV